MSVSEKETARFREILGSGARVEDRSPVHMTMHARSE